MCVCAGNESFKYIESWSGSVSVYAHTFTWPGVTPQGNRQRVYQELTLPPSLWSDLKNNCTICTYEKTSWIKSLEFEWVSPLHSDFRVKALLPAWLQDVLSTPVRMMLGWTQIIPQIVCVWVNLKSVAHGKVFNFLSSVWSGCVAFGVWRAERLLVWV